jgi:hypothetical protein
MSQYSFSPYTPSVQSQSQPTYHTHRDIQYFNPRTGSYTHTSRSGPSAVDIASYLQARPQTGKSYTYTPSPSTPGNHQSQETNRPWYSKLNPFSSRKSYKEAPFSVEDLVSAYRSDQERTQAAQDFFIEQQNLAAAQAAKDLTQSSPATFSTPSLAFGEWRKSRGLAMLMCRHE